MISIIQLRWVRVLVTAALVFSSMLFAGAIASAAPQQVASNSTSIAASSSRSISHSSASTTKKKTSKKHRARREPMQKAPTPDRISEIQSSLASNGFYQGNPNGKWDASTVGAMQKFQSANGLEPTGKLDALSLQKLGLGSDIAGVSAPRQAAPPGCCSNSFAPSSGTPGGATPIPNSSLSSPKPVQQ
jgi:peptidoglycan hydrolase-like protein with peptidoglycan-binding domain